MQIAGTALKAGDIPGAMKYLVKGLEAMRKTNDLPTEGSLLIQLTEIHIHNQSEDQAMKYLEEALGVSQKIKDRSMEGRTLWIWSQTLGKTGNLAGVVTGGRKLKKFMRNSKSPKPVTFAPKLRNGPKTECFRVAGHPAFSARETPSPPSVVHISQHITEPGFFPCQ